MIYQYVQEENMGNTTDTMEVKCSGAKIIRIPPGRRREIPKMEGTLPSVGDVILYNERVSDGMHTRGHRFVEKRGCMHVTSITKALVCGEAERICKRDRIKRNISLNINDILMGKTEYVRLNSTLIPENLYDNDQLELLENEDTSIKISKLPLELRKQVIV